MVTFKLKWVVIAPKPGRRLDDWFGIARLFDAPARRLAQVVEKADERRHEFLHVAFVQALVRGVGVTGWVFDAEQKCRRAAEQFAQGADEADRAAAADGDRVLVESFAKRSHGGLERGAVRVGHPPVDMSAGL